MLKMYFLECLFTRSSLIYCHEDANGKDFLICLRAKEKDLWKAVWPGVSLVKCKHIPKSTETDREPQFTDSDGPAQCESQLVCAVQKLESA